MVKKFPLEMLRAKCKKLYADAGCHEGALYQMSALDEFGSEWSYADFLMLHNTLLILPWSLVA
jgi:hypothetical protein